MRLLRNIAYLSASALASASTPLVPAGTFCSVAGRIDYDGIFLMDLIGNPSNVTIDETHFLQEVFLESYAQSVTCTQQGAFRTIESIHILPDKVDSLGDFRREESKSTSSSDTRNFSYLVYIHGQCNGCNMNSLVFRDQYMMNTASSELQNENDIIGSLRASRNQDNVGYHSNSKRERKVEEIGDSTSTFLSHESTDEMNKANNEINRDVEEGRSDACNCEAPLLSDFLSIYNGAIHDATDVKNIDSIFDLTNMEEMVDRSQKDRRRSLENRGVRSMQITDEGPLVGCASEISDFNTTVLMEYVGNPSLLESERLSLEDTFVTTYNAIADQYCDPFNRSLTKAEIINIDSNTDRVNPTIQFRVMGLCQGCQSDTSLYDSPSFSESNGLRDIRRKLLLTPSKDDLHLRGLQSSGCNCDNNTIPDRGPSEVATVRAYRERIETLILPNVEGIGECPDTDEFETTILLAYEGDPDLVTERDLTVIGQSFLETFNSISCDPLFREVTDVTVVVDVEINAEFTNSFPTNANPSINRRFLQNDNANDNANPNVNPNANPNLPVPSFPVMILFVGGRCKGCGRQANLFDQTSVTTPRYLQEELFSHRQLVEEIYSKCFCPIDAEIVRTTEDEYTEIFAEVVEELSRQDELEFIDSIASANEVLVLNCTLDVDIFNSTLSIEVVADQPELAETEIITLQEDLVATYNRVALQYCDPFFRRLTNATLNTTEVLEQDDENTFLLRLNFIVSVRCRGCDQDAVILVEEEFPDSLDNSFLENAFDYEPGGENVTLVCVCEIFAIAESAQSNSDFSVTVAPSVERLPSVRALIGVSNDPPAIEPQVVEPPTIEVPPFAFISEDEPEPEEESDDDDFGEPDEPDGETIDFWSLVEDEGLVEKIPTPSPTKKPTMKPTMEPTIAPTVNPLPAPTPTFYCFAPVDCCTCSVAVFSIDSGDGCVNCVDGIGSCSGGASLCSGG